MPTLTRANVRPMNRSRAPRVSSWFDDVFADLSTTAGQASYTVGNVANQLIGAGLSASAISQILNGVATSATATPDMIHAAQMENAYALAQLNAQNQNKVPTWVWGAAIVGAVLIFSGRRD